MLVVHVHVRVKPECAEAFRAATLRNAEASLKEPGIARFDVVRSLEDPLCFVLVEVYRDADAPAAHKEAAHYLVWKDTVASMMAEPRSSLKYVNLHPSDPHW